jgi:integrase
MSLKPPSLWIEQRGKQHRVYWRNSDAGLPARSYLPFYGRDAAEHFVGSAALLGLHTARQVFTTEDPQAAAALVQAALAERGLAPVDSGPALAPAGPLPQSAAPADPRLTGVTFRKLWHSFLDRQHHVEEGTRSDYTSYGEYHLLPFFGDTDIGLILRTEPLRAADVPAGAVYVEEGWLKEMLKKERRNNAGRFTAGTVLSHKFINNVLDVLGQCFEVALAERPPLLNDNPARGIRLPKHDRREMHFLEDAAAYAVLRDAMHPHFQKLMDFLVGTGSRYGEAAGLLVRHLHLDADRPYVDIRLALKWRGKKWKLGRPKTRSSVRRILLPSRLVDVLRPLVAGKSADDHVFTMVEGGPLHHGNFFNRYWKEAVKAAAGAQVPKGTRIHDLRHTHAAWLLSDGVAPLVVAARLGHSSATTTQNVYGHITTEADDRAIDIVNGRLPEVLARDEEGATVIALSAAEERLPEFDIDDEDDLAA